jgi:hypothetical protein
VSGSFRGYCIKLTDLRSLVENPPAGLHDEIRERVKRLYQQFDPNAEVSRPSTREELIQLLKSDPRGFLVEMICAVRGVPIKSVFFEDVHLMALYEALEAGMEGGVCERLKEPRLPVPLPPDEGDPPWISYLTLQEIEEGLARPDREDPDMDNWVADARDDLRAWLETAREHGTDLVVFGT